MKKEPSSEKFHPGNGLLVAGSHMLHHIYSSFLAPLRPLLIEKFGVSLALASIWDLIMCIPYSFNPVIGIIAERTAARKLSFPEKPCHTELVSVSEYQQVIDTETSSG